MSDLTRTDGHIEYLFKDGVRVAMFDEKGELLMLKTATKTDRQSLFAAYEKAALTDKQ